jgi:hypothetical protein
VLETAVVRQDLAIPLCRLIELRVEHEWRKAGLLALRVGQFQDTHRDAGVNLRRRRASRRGEREGGE